MNHTPGPWTIGNNAPDYHGRLTIRDTNGWEIVQMPGLPIDRPHPKQDANARLISAAPELLEALKELVNELEICREWGSLTNDHVVLNEPLTAAKKAIAKAEGKDI